MRRPEWIVHTSDTSDAGIDRHGNPLHQWHVVATLVDWDAGTLDELRHLVGYLDQLEEDCCGVVHCARTPTIWIGQKGIPHPAIGVVLTTTPLRGSPDTTWSLIIGTHETSRK